MKNALRVPDYLGHIRDAIERIFLYLEDIDETKFARSTLIQDAVIRNIEIIGEASRNIERADPEFVKRHPEMEFANARAMRNAVTHGYHKVDLGVIWRTIEENLGVLHQQVLDALRENPDEAT